MGNLFSRRDQHPFFGDVITKARNMKKSNLLRQHYIEPPPKSHFYDLITVTKTMPAKKLLLGAFGTSIFTVLLISTLYYGASCVGTSFDNIIMITLQQIIGAGTAEGFEQTFVCRTLVTGTTLLNVVFKSVTFALMVSKFDNVTPQIYFTPNCVMNFRNGMATLQMRVMNAQGTLLDVENLTAQWAKPSKTSEGESYGKLFEVKMSAFQMIKSPISVSHTIDETSPFHGSNLKKLKGTLFVSLVVWDPIVQKAVRAMTYYQLGKDVHYNMRFDDITVKTSADATKVGGNPTSDATRFNSTVPLEIDHKKKNSKNKKPSNEGGGSVKKTSSSSEPMTQAVSAPSKSDTKIRGQWKEPKQQPGHMRTYSEYVVSSSKSLLEENKESKAHSTNMPSKNFQSFNPTMPKRLSMATVAEEPTSRNDQSSAEQMSISSLSTKPEGALNGSLLTKQWSSHDKFQMTPKSQALQHPAIPQQQFVFVNNQPRMDEPLGQPLSLSAMGGQPQVVDHTEVQFLPYDAIVLGTGGVHLRNTGEFMKTCSYCASVEMAMMEMNIPFKLLYTQLYALEKEPWLIRLHPRGKPTVPMLWSHGRWIFDTPLILEELQRRFPGINGRHVNILKIQSMPVLRKYFQDGGRSRNWPEQSTKAPARKKRSDH